MATQNEKLGYDLGFEELAKVLMRSMGISKGLWSLQTRFAVTPTNYSLDGQMATAVPTIINQIVGISLNPADMPGPLVYDAALLNPLGLHHEKVSFAMPNVPLPLNTLSAK